MTRLMMRLTSIVTLLLTLLISTAHAQGRRDWVPLGQQTVGFRVDRDVINVGQSEEWYRNRAFRSLYFLVERNDVFMMAIRLVYLNGYSEDFRIDRMITQNGQYELELRGERSFIRQIEMIYRARPDFRGEAVVKVFGVPARGFAGGPPGPGPGGGDWVELGCQQVNIFGRDRDTIRVGRRDGRFKAIRLHVRDADVEVIDLKVIYSNGQPDDIAVKNLIRAGERTRPLDLQGWERAIDRVELVYRTVVGPADIVTGQPGQIRGGGRIRMATVCVEGMR